MSRADDAHEESEDEEPDSIYTEEEILAMNTAQLGRNRTKRRLIPLVIGGIAILLLVGLLIGVASIQNPGYALKGYAVSASDVSPVWSAFVLFNISGPAKYKVHNLVRAK